MVLAEEVITGGAADDIFEAASDITEDDTGGWISDIVAEDVGVLAADGTAPAGVEAADVTDLVMEGEATTAGTAEVERWEIGAMILAKAT